MKPGDSCSRRWPTLPLRRRGYNRSVNRDPGTQELRVKIACQLLIAAFLSLIALGCASKSSQSHEPALGLSKEPSLASAPSVKGTGDESTNESASIRQRWQFGDVQGLLITTPNYRL